MWFKRFVSFFDKCEDRVRARLSRMPILYALIGGIGIVLFWKGVWEVTSYFPWLSGFGSMLAGVIILLSTGLLVSFFIGENIIISGFKGEKKLAEKTESEVRQEADLIHHIEERLNRIEEDITHLSKHT